MELIDRIREYVCEFFERVGVVDYSVGLSVDGVKTYFTAGGMYGEGNAAHSLNDLPGPFEIGCIFTPFLAAASLELIARGVLNLRDPIGMVLSELADSEKGAAISARHLLSRTAGYRGFDLFVPIGQFHEPSRAFARIRNTPQHFFPGVVFNYENACTALLGEILNRVAGEPRALIDKTIFDPIGIRPGTGHSPFSLTMSIVDLMAVVELLMGRCPHHCLNDWTVNHLQEEVVRIPRNPGTSAERLLPSGYTLGLEVFRGDFFGYDGNVVNQVVGFRFDRARRVAVALGINRGAPVLRRVFLGGLLDLLREVGFTTPSYTRVAVHDVLHGPVEGTYVGNDFEIVEVDARGRDVQLRFAPRGSSEGARLHGRRSAEGRIVFDVSVPGIDPVFFRYARTDETCLMVGMKAFKRVPVLQL